MIYSFNFLFVLGLGGSNLSEALEHVDIATDEFHDPGDSPAETPAVIAASSETSESQPSEATEPPKDASAGAAVDQKTLSERLRNLTVQRRSSCFKFCTCHSASSSSFTTILPRCCLHTRKQVQKPYFCTF